MKLSDIKGEEALDVLADIIEPCARIVADKEIANMLRANVPKIEVVKLSIKNHKKEVIEILARLDLKEPSEYEQEITLATLPVKLVEIFNDPVLLEVFQSQVQTSSETPSGLATENTEGNEK